jgi:hypothetical protein
VCTPVARQQTQKKFSRGTRKSRRKGNTVQLVSSMPAPQFGGRIFVSGRFRDGSIFMRFLHFVLLDVRCFRLPLDMLTPDWRPPHQGVPQKWNSNVLSSFDGLPTKVCNSSKWTVKINGVWRVGSLSMRTSAFTCRNLPRMPTSATNRQKHCHSLGYCGYARKLQINQVAEGQLNLKGILDPEG